MLLRTQNVSKAYGPHTILERISFVINAKDRVGLVGPNGVGKSTLLRILTGLEERDGGDVTYAAGCEMGYLPQTQPDRTGFTIQDLVLQSVGNLKHLEQRMHELELAMAKASSSELATLLEEYTLVSTRFQDRGGYRIDYQMDMIFAGLNITYLPRTQLVQTLSGGEKARVGLACLLLRSPDILLLDEPTNHLDFASISWLEEYIKSYTGAVLMVSHDRQFLNKTVNLIFELNEYTKETVSYTGDYSTYVNTKQAQREKWEADYERQQEEMRELRRRIRTTGRQLGHTNRAPRDNDKFARHFFAQNQQSAVASNIRAAEVQLERLEQDPIPKPPELLSINTQITTQALQSTTVMRVTDVAKSYDAGQRCILRDISFTLQTQTRMLLIGPNGAGKTTLLKLLSGSLQPDRGNIFIAEGAKIGYLAQEPEPFDAAQTVLEAYKYGQIGFESEFIARLIGYGLFRLEDMHRRVGQLSPGQLRKLEIARLMAAQPQILLLDEPTNYISLDVLETFEASLHAFPGPIIAISHDRWFIDRFDAEIWELHDGQLSTKEQRV